jgi:DNA polymerase-1
MLYFIGPYETRFKTAGVMDVVNFMERESKFCFDTETTGLNPHSSKVIMVQVGNEDTQFVIDTRHVDITPMLPYLESPDKMKIGANLAFDYKMLLSNYGIRLQNLGDVMIREMVLENGRKSRGFGLKDLAKKYLKISMPKEVRNEFTRMRNQPFNQQQILYGAKDVKIPMDIYHKQQIRIRDDQLGVVIHLEQQYVRVIAEMEYHGLPFNREIWRDLYKQNQEALKTNKEALDDYLIKNNATKFIGTVDMFTGKPEIKVNWGSPKQVAEVFKHFGVPVSKVDHEKTNKLKDDYGIDFEVTKDSVSKDDLTRLADAYPFAGLFMKYRKTLSAVTKYGIDWLNKYVSDDDRVRSRFRQILNTGRISSTSPNLQNIPSFKDPAKVPWEAHRSAIHPKGDWRFIVRDYDSQESRILADNADEDSMIREYIHGKGDMHSLTGTKVFSRIEGKQVTVSKTENKHYRTIAKTVNFGIAYGIGPAGLSRNLNISKEMASDIINAFYESYPKLTEYFDRRHEEVMRDGYLVVDDFTKRRVYFPEHKVFKEYMKEVERYQELKYRNRVLGYDEPEYPEEAMNESRRINSKLRRAAQNYSIQGAAASMTKIAQSTFYDWVRKENLFDKVKIVLALHDELVVEAHKDVAELVNEKLAHYMDSAGSYFCKKIPTTSSGHVGMSWEH